MNNEYFLLESFATDFDESLRLCGNKNYVILIILISNKLIALLCDLYS